MLPDFQYVLAHPDILTELPAIRGLLRKRYPSLQHGLLFKYIKLILGKYNKNNLNYRYTDVRFNSYGKTLHKGY